MKKYFFLILLLGTAATAAAYTPITTGSGLFVYWTNPTISFWINVSGSPQIANGSDFTAIQAAFQTWAGIPTASLRFNYMGTTPVATVGEDGVNLITFVDSSVPIGSDTAAATFSFLKLDDGGNVTIEEADIAVNPSVALSTSGESDKYDIQGILTHEIGHFIGLDDSGLMSSVMAPFSAPGQIGQRTLTFDDMAGATWLYANANGENTLGVLTGAVGQGETGYIGVHVVAIDSNGTPLASSVSLYGGVYYILVPLGTYKVYAEPLDGPLYEGLIGGNPSSMYYQIPTNFSTTYYGGTALQSAATAVTINESAAGDLAGTGASSSNSPVTVFLNASLNTPYEVITLLSPAGSAPNITQPNTFATQIAVGSSQNLTLGGTNLTASDSFASSNSGVTLGAPAFGGGIAADAPASATLNVTVATGTALGPKNIAVSLASSTSVLSGAIVVTNPQPTGIQVGPASGPIDGGTNVTISGANFQASPQVYFAGLPAANVQLVNATTIQATTPANVSGNASVMVVNSDGTWGVAASAFTYNTKPPQITGVTPLNGPPATIITIQGSEFDSRPANLAVTINGLSAPVITASRTSVTAAIPYGATSGAVAISVLGAGATGPTFTVTATPVSTNTQPSPSFLDASPATGGTPVSFSDPDDSSALVTLPFNFTLFNKLYPAATPIAVCVNGWISLDAFTRPEFQNTSLPAQTVQHSNGSSNPVPPALIAPFFQDLVLRSVSSVSYKTIGTAPNRQFIVEWINLGILNAQSVDTGGTISFQAVLYEGSNDIEFQYEAGTGMFSDGSGATIGIQDSTRTLAVQSSYDKSILAGGSAVFYTFTAGNYSGGFNQLPFSLVDAGGFSSTSNGSNSNLTVGYATIQPAGNGTVPAGVAIFGYREGNILVTESGVPASPLMQHGILYAEVTGAVGTTNTVDTGVAVANPNGQAATVTFNFTDNTGKTFGSGSTTIPANGQIAAFLDQAPFNGGTHFQGTFSFNSTVPISMIALRGLTNQRTDFLISTLPVIDTTAAIPATPAVVPEFADGGGWTTQILLINPGSKTMTGTVQFVAASGQAASLTANGQTSSSFTYSVPANSSFKLLTSGAASATTVGSVIVTPAAANVTPTALAIFSYKPAGITVSEAGVPPISGNAFRMYVEASGTFGSTGSIQTGLAIANPTSSTAIVNFSLTSLSGASIGVASLNVPANGQVQEFVNQIFSNLTLPSPLQGVLTISSSTSGLSVIGLRERYNERGDFLITTTPPTNDSAPANTTQMAFPHLPDGGGYTTQFILFSGSSGQSTAGLLKFVTQAGTTLHLGFQ